jgi:hypothetical protein
VSVVVPVDGAGLADGVVVLVVSYPPVDGALMLVVSELDGTVRLVVSAGGCAGTVWCVVSVVEGAVDGVLIVSVLNELVSDLTIAVSLFTIVLSPRSGAAPVSSDRLWQAAKVAAAARIQRVFMISPSSDRALPAGASSPMYVSRGPTIQA